MKYLGAHIPSLGGLDKAIINAIAINCNAIQLFLGGRISWRINMTSQITVNNNLKKYIHSPYVVNLANLQDKEKLTRSLELVGALLLRGEELSFDGVVVHTGSIINTEISRNEALEKLSDIIIPQLDNFIKEHQIKKCKLLFEPSSGAGSSIAYNPATIASYFSIYPKELDWWGICIDTCHIYCSGLNLHDKEAVKSFFSSELLQRRLALIHLNNTNDEIGSRKDRHRNIENGKIKLEEFVYLMRQIDNSVPIILETPGIGRKNDLKSLVIYREDNQE